MSVSVALLIQNAKRMRRTMLLSVACTAVLSSHKRQEFREKNTEYKTCFNFMYNLCLTYLPS
jgi:hypothetical protein